MADPSVAQQAPPEARPRRHRVRYAVLAIALLLAALALYLFLRPVGVAVPAGHAAPAASWSEAVARIAEVQASEAVDPTILPECRTRLLDQGGPTDQVVVLLHGYTNCPKQYDRLAQEFADRGYTVYVPRVPDHGMLPGSPGLLGSLTAEEIAAYGDDAMDIASGLGDRVTVLGLSGGGAVASYIAQFREDADRVVAIASFLSTPSIPEPLVRAAINAIDLLPAFDQREAPPDEATRGAYPHGASDTSTHGAAAYMHVGQTVMDEAGRQPPKAGDIVVVINDADDTVNNAMIESLESRWRALAPHKVSEYRFSASQDVLHDMITPDREGQKVDLVYPALLDLVARP